ncbi:hypothetical protein M0208_06325 [Sphingomonas sp. SUN019]|uniref:hypothetical protein n=1 Tax=Sphingomonas sp. SUN019 TaxID=2937788 RepID=UPI0021644075|nr:hypothetical protein [Sphingomonas sp. SUN019]UVO50153.1 hypothetical protein M0208_06325 [Sphingomonas sp. SUN019]
MRTFRPASAAAALLALCAGTTLAAQPVATNLIVARPQTILLTAQTPVELMVTKEVTGRTAKPGERFKLRVNKAVVVDGATIVPIGATAWGEVLASSGTGIAGGKGRLSSRLLYIDAPGGRIEVSGTQGHEGDGNTAGVVLGVLSFGVLGLLSKGTDARLKAGDLLTGYVVGDHSYTPDGVLIAAVPHG